MTQLSIILLTWNAERHLTACIDSLLQSVATISHEVIVVDNGSTDRTLALLQPYVDHGHIRLLKQPQNRGVSQGRNIGIRESKGDYIWLLDIDTVVNPAAVTALCDFMVQHPTCGICGCKLYDAYGEVQDSCRKLPSLRYKTYNVLSSLLNRFNGFNQLKRRIETANASQFYHQQMQGELPFEAEYIIGACQMIRREAMEQVGLLDEKIFYGPEDADYCLRMWQAGWSVYYLPQLSFFHDYRRMTNKKLLSRMSFIHIKALIYFFWKHRNR